MNKLHSILPIGRHSLAMQRRSVFALLGTETVNMLTHVVSNRHASKLVSSRKLLTPRTTMASKTRDTFPVSFETRHIKELQTFHYNYHLNNS